MSKLKNEYDTAEAWLRAAFDALRPDFEAISASRRMAARRPGLQVELWDGVRADLASMTMVRESTGMENWS
jgi:hypothetical protein